MLLVALALASLASPSPQGAPAPDASFDAASALKARAAYREAAEAFEAIAEADPPSPRRQEALVEAGVCRFSAGRAALLLHRITPPARAQFDQALQRFDRVLADYPATATASRAAYMRGSTHFFAGDLEQAEAAYGRALEEFAADRGYAGKALERRAFVRRHLLEPAGAIADYERWLKEFRVEAEAGRILAHLALARTLGEPAPLITAETWAHGEPAPLETLGGRVVALYFFATWCPDCAKELPFVLDLARRRGGEDLRFVGVMDASRGQTRESIARYCAEHALPFPVLMPDAASARAWNVATIPHLVLIDRDGRVRWRDSPANLAEATVDALVSNGPDPQPGK